MKKLTAAILCLVPSLSFADTLASFYQADDVNLGAEINPISLLASDGSRVHLSGGFSVFQKSHNAEINFPIEYKNIQDKGEQFTVLNLGAQYRKFLEQDSEGYYFSGVARYTNINSDVNKLGLGFGFGYRNVTRSGLYWGWGASIGRYLGDSDQFKDSQLSDVEIIEDKEWMLDVEFLKIGMMF